MSIKTRTILIAFAVIGSVFVTILLSFVVYLSGMKFISEQKSENAFRNSRESIADVYSYDFLSKGLKATMTLQDVDNLFQRAQKKSLEPNPQVDGAPSARYYEFSYGEDSNATPSNENTVREGFYVFFDNDGYADHVIYSRFGTFKSRMRDVVIDLKSKEVKKMSSLKSDSKK